MSNNETKIIPVILCGGSGTRLWPLSREKAPKQFLPVLGEESLIHNTLNRAAECSGCKHDEIISVTADNIQKETQHQLNEFDFNASKHLISEPAARNTAPAICYAALHAQKHFGNDAVLWIMPSDHHVEDQQTLKDAVKRASSLAKEGYIVTFGMAPTRPETGYGYIKSGADIAGHDCIQAVEQFVEKPDQETAKSYIEDGNYVWNSGMFVGTVQTFIENFMSHCPDVIQPMSHGFKEGAISMNETYPSLPSTPFDIAIMEKTNKAAVIPCDIGWSDVGGWNSVHELKEKDAKNNVIEGRVAAIDTQDCLIKSHSLLIATMGVRNLIIIEHRDSVLIADRNSADSLKQLVEALRKSDSPEAICPPMESRPWGEFKVLSESANYKVKELMVVPDGVLSLQMHHHRCEFWTVISGEATVTINDEVSTLGPQESAHIPFKATHRLENKGTEPLIMVEVQCGDYLGEDDIVRFDDKYGRIEAA